MFSLLKRFTGSTYWRQRVRLPIALLGTTYWPSHTNQAGYEAQSVGAGGTGDGPGGLWGQPEPPPAGFVNQTRHSDAELWTIWKAAQETLAHEIDLNPLQRSFSGAPADIRPGDARALKVQPHQLRVGAKRDVSSTVLMAATGLDRDNPTGMIACPQPCNVRYAAAYSVYSRDLTQYAASWEDEGDSFTFVLEYEFENQILASLGYSLKWR